jgi:exodeoxyribonuclease VII large subunit
MTMQPIFSAPISWSVAEVTRYVRGLLEGDPALQDVWVAGEVSNYTRASSGHVYFTLKDATASLRCVMWRNTVLRQRYLPREGDAIEAHGGIGVYEAGGQYQLYVDAIRPVGEGALYQEFLRLKERLEAEGLFDSQRKRPIPRWPRRIGIVTSPTGAALRDMLNTLRRRYPLVEVVLAPSPVQGSEAPARLVQALSDLQRLAQLDVILVARGGGSIEDLWAFNDEQVARAIASSSIPVICGVGHETDFTIADFAADLRAPTPTAAAELATPDREELRQSLVEVSNTLARLAQAILAQQRWSVDGIANRLGLHSPIRRIQNDRQRLDDFLRRASSQTRHTLLLQRTRLSGMQQRLAALNPGSVLKRGYAVVTRPDGSLVRSAWEVRGGDDLLLNMKDGRIDVQVRSASTTGEI